ncbi:hypothetical protein HPB52_016786 [Rhipicephalus sanguineus]|uniref:Uncharacterized protein n=1 Tax=Rhipicephalus sanguineus TaxID=34632 RepID=A0A9D4PJW8_RHISA|nr:hypothetical protein HPB52_016786 [Rhipicephalus sanguineus]
MHYVDTYERKARNVLRQYIVHVGLTDALRQDRCRITQTLKTSWHNRMAKLVVCSIPEITSRGEETRAAIHLANAQLRNWCKRSRHKFLDINEGWRPDMMDKDGIHYNNTGVCSVAMKISTVAQAFLEQRRSGDKQPRPQTPQRHNRKSPRRSKDSRTTPKVGHAHQMATAGQQRKAPHPVTGQHPAPLQLPGLPAWVQTPTFPWTIPDAPNTMYHTVGELVRHHLVMATRVRQ